MTVPVFQSATYEMGPSQRYGDVRYVRLNNSPNHIVLADRLAAVCEAEDAVVTASGMSAIATALLSILQSGDHLLAQSTLYGGTVALLDQEMPRQGILHSLIDIARPETWADAVQDNTRLIYVEAIANPRMSIGELDAVVDFARARGLVTVIDNTFASPFNFRPLSIGFDVEVHSATKYLNGHSDVAAGVIAGSRQRIAAARSHLNHFGASLDPHACFLLERGLKTLGLRMRQHNENAAALAEMLHHHPNVREVFYPGLPSTPGHPVARRRFDGFSGMLAFLPTQPAEDVIGKLSMATHAPSLGGLETLVVQPAKSSHLGLTPAQRVAAGIADDLIRVSVGCEDSDDILNDFLAAL
ncbi:MAG: aminotransferase class I/II-fold pyridoxal phosphate-dependent enzyme [Myxococcota bacterium]